LTLTDTSLEPVTHVWGRDVYAQAAARLGHL
jgi:S-adenosylmethionine hydrolase